MAARSIRRAGVAAAAIGLYAVLSFSVANRTREIGIRLALGADASNVFAVVVRDGLLFVLVGIVLGIAGARVLASSLYGVSTVDAATYVAVTAILAIVALVACAIPARRAMRLDPLAALRYQ